MLIGLVLGASYVCARSASLLRCDGTRGDLSDAWRGIFVGKAQIRGSRGAGHSRRPWSSMVGECVHVVCMLGGMPGGGTLGAPRSR